MFHLSGTWYSGEVWSQFRCTGSLVHVRYCKQQRSKCVHRGRIDDSVSRLSIADIPRHYVTGRSLISEGGMRAGWGATWGLLS